MLNSLGQPVRYQVTARSVSANQTMQELDLTEDVTMDPAYAQRRSDAYAERLNQQRFLQCADWRGVAVPITHPGA
jgi:hypothetical protein